VAENIIVWGIVGVVVFLVGRWFRRVLGGNTGGCGCGSGSAACRQAGYCGPTAGVDVDDNHTDEGIPRQDA
jgi:hypothetical protein